MLIQCRYSNVELKGIPSQNKSNQNMYFLKNEMNPHYY